MNDLPRKGDHVHLIAVCGVGMASLAGLLKSQGYRVTGSDQNVYPPMSNYLKEIGIDILPEYRAEHIDDSLALVIVGNAVSRNNPEVEAVLARNIPYVSFPDALGKFLIGARQSLVVVGTHGKTTTTALAAWVMSRAGLNPGFFVGGVPLNFGSGWNPGNGDHVVLEGDEYDSAFFDKGPKFLHYRPFRVIFTSLEFDHADIYRDLDHLKDAFRRLMRLIPSDGLLVAYRNDAAVRDVVAASPSRVIYYGNTDVGWSPRNVRAELGRTFFQACYNGRPEGELELNLIGHHNVNNALAVYIMGREIGLTHPQLFDGLATFAGVRRRQEVKGERGGILVIDDFAHHPTAVKQTIAAVKDAYPGRRLWAIFEPRSNTSRRRVFTHEFADAFLGADQVIIGGLYLPEKIPESERLDPTEVVEEINRLSKPGRARHVRSNVSIPDIIAGEARPGDIVLVMSNGGFDAVQEKILEALTRKAHSVIYSKG